MENVGKAEEKDGTDVKIEQTMVSRGANDGIKRSKMNELMNELMNGMNEFRNCRWMRKIL